MKTLIAAAVVLSVGLPVYAGPQDGLAGETHEPEVWYQHDAPDRGRIIHSNRVTTKPIQEYFHIETPFGLVVLEMRRTPNTSVGCACPDVLTVIELPLGATAHPLEVETPEDGESEIIIRPYLGG